MSPAETRAEVLKLRKLLWLAHIQIEQHAGRAYGDDGEMQCCGIDFQRADVQDIHDALSERAWAALATEPPQPASDPPATIHDSPAQRLRWFVRKHALGGCKVLSDLDCRCPLCDVDRLTGAAPQAPLQPASAGTEVEAWLTVESSPPPRHQDVDALKAAFQAGRRSWVTREGWQFTPRFEDDNDEHSWDAYLAHLSQEARR